MFRKLSCVEEINFDRRQFKTSVSRETIQTLMKIDKFREESENNLSRNEANSTIKHIGLMVAFDNVNYYQNCLFKNK